jgi:phage baseplate assembly protein W
MALYNDYRTAATTSTDAAAINNSIKNILLTRKGSVPGKPTFGSNLDDVLFNQLDHITKSLLEDQIVEALTQWEKRILVTNVLVQDVPEYNKLIATISYKYRDKGLDINEQISVGFIQ